MDQRRRDASPVSGGMTALLVFLGFIGILLVGFGVTSMIRDSERTAVSAPAEVQPATQTEPATTPPQNPAPTTPAP